MRYLTTIFGLLFVLMVQAQNGKIRGTVFDSKTGETLIGVTVVPLGTTTGAITDLDGAFTIDVPAGKYNLQVSYISYQTMKIEDIEVKAGEVTPLSNIQLKESSLELGEVVITAQSVRTTEAALQTIKKKSAVIMDGITAAKIQLTGDGTAVEAAKRVTGVSIEGGKYVYVRGLGDRYSKTTLNNMDIPGLDPDRNSLQMDIFPTNLIDNIIVGKNFTADMPADFTGGIMNVETKAFPESRVISVSLGLSYNPAMHFNAEHLAYEGGAKDFLGFDDGTRALPSGADLAKIPTPISGHSKDDVGAFISGFNPTLSATEKTSLMDYSFGFSIGDQISLNSKRQNSPKLGYTFSAAYKSGSNYYNDVVYSEYQRFIDPDTHEMRYATIQNGRIGEQNVLVGLLGGIAYKTNYSKIRLTAMHLQNGESTAAIFEIDNDGQAVGQSGYEATSHALSYNQRALSNLLLGGTTVFKESGWEMDWGISPTLSSSHDPDIRKTAFTHTSTGPEFSAGAGGNPARLWRSLTELSISSRLDITKNYSFLGNSAKLKFGTSHSYKKRDYEILFFDVQFFGAQPNWETVDPSLVLQSENLYPQGTIYYQSGNNTPNPNQYSSNVNNTGFYVSNEMEPAKGLKAILGVRMENYVQRHTGRDQTYASGDTKNGRNLVNDKVLESLDFFPSVNVIYALTERQNVRISYSRTIARPSFKELSFAQILDPLSNRIFNGSLFTYSDWDGQLTETRIDNLDLRWEIFLEEGQTFSVSGFYKQFDNPIELVRIPEQQTSTEYQPRNVGDGSLYGIELEFSKNLAFIADALANFSLSSNFTYVDSQIEMTETEYNSRKNYQKAGENIENTRQMAGQAPYVVNSGISFNHAEAGIQAGLFYNVKGPTLNIVGVGLFPDVYNDPFHSLNFGINKSLGAEKNAVIDFKISNLLNDKHQIYYKSYGAADQLYESKTEGITISLGISYKF